MELKLGTNPVCTECIEENNQRRISPPISIFHIGENFGNDKYKVLFVGKNARGTLEYCETYPEVIDARKKQKNILMMV
jgi:hypothetical protein